MSAEGSGQLREQAEWYDREARRYRARAVEIVAPADVEIRRHEA